MKSIYTTTTKYAAVALSLLLAACTTDLYNEDDDKPIIEPTDKGLNIPDDFDFSVVSTRTITVNVVDEYDGTKDYTVEGYVDNPVFNTSAKLLFRRKTNEKSPCVIDNVTFANTVKTLYIRQTDPYGLKTVYAFPLEGKGNGDIVCDLKPAEAPETKAAGQLRSAEYPVNFDKGDAIRVTNAGKIEDGGKYFIPGNVHVPITDEGTMENVTLYVEGTLWFNNKNVEDFVFENCQIYVLNGGKIDGKGETDIKCTQGTDIHIEKGGVLEGIDELSMEKNESSDDCVIYNEGIIKVNDLSVNGTQIHNYCLIDIEDDFESEDAGSSLYLYGGAFLCDEFEMSGSASVIYFWPRAILKGNSAEFNDSNVKIVGAGYGADLSKNDWGVFQFNKLILNYRGDGSTYWCVEFACPPVEGPGKLPGMISSGIEKDGNIIPSFVIEPTPCNGNTSSKPETKPEEPGGPATEQPGETETYTFLFEDNWPVFGDYDMNDVVVDLNVANQEIEGNSAKSAIVTASLRAVGATKDLYLFVRADNMVQDEIPLFDGKEAHACLGNFNRSQMINTEQYDSDPVQYQTTVELTGGTLSVGTLDVYIVWGDPNASERNEIHLKGFSGTSRAKVSGTSVHYQYKSESDEGDKYHNMMWGLMIPQSFKYPKELHSIMEVYPDFIRWAQSNGVDCQDWYLNPQGPIYAGK